MEGLFHIGLLVLATFKLLVNVFPLALCGAWAFDLVQVRWNGWRAFKWATFWFSVAFVLILNVIGAIAHEAPSGWAYPKECCSEQDCEFIHAFQVKRGDDGWHLPNGEVVAFEAARPSGDHMFHWCRMIDFDEFGNGGHVRGPVIRPHNKPICFFAPEPGG